MLEQGIETSLVNKLKDLKYSYRPELNNRSALENNFRVKFEELNRVKLTDGEFARLLDEIITPDVFTAAKILRNINAFTRDDGTPLNYSLVNLKDWCKNHFEVINQLRINTNNSHHRFDVILLINGVPVVQIELKGLGINPRRAMEQIVEYKSDPGNGYTKTLLCFMQLYIVSNRDRTYYIANNNSRHFAFNADEQFLPIYEFASEDNRKITHLDEFAACFLKGRSLPPHPRAKEKTLCPLPTTTGACSMISLRSSPRSTHSTGKRSKLTRPPSEKFYAAAAVMPA